MCSLASLAKFPVLIEDLFQTKVFFPHFLIHMSMEWSCTDIFNIFQEAVDEGVYQLKFCKNGHWVCVTVDDYFPCKPEDGPVYSKANGAELWVLLVEKVFHAKI